MQLACPRLRHGLRSGVRCAAAYEDSSEERFTSAAGRTPLDLMLCSKVLMLQMLYKLADGAVAYQTRDQLSFMRFLGLEL